MIYIFLLITSQNVHIEHIVHYVQKGLEEIHMNCISISQAWSNFAEILNKVFFLATDMWFAKETKISGHLFP